MSEENKALFRRTLEEIFVGGDADSVDEVTHPDFVEHEVMPGMPSNLKGAEVPKWFIRAMHAGVSNIEVDLQDVIAEGDLVAARWTMRGTHTGEFMGIPATNKSFEVEGIDIVRIRDGKISEHWGLTDAMGMMQQLGLAEMPTG